MQCSLKLLISSNLKIDLVDLVTHSCDLGIRAQVFVKKIGKLDLIKLLRLNK